MTMHLYVLIQGEGNVVEKLSPVWGGTKLRFHGDWYTARGDCFRHAIEHGHRSFCIVGHAVQLYHRHHPQDAPKATQAQRNPQPYRMADKGQHGLWLYLDRLLLRHGHVYVPPLSWAKQKGHEHYCNPTIPMVAGYQTRALQWLDNFDTPSVGQRLCANGFDSFTLSDYFYHNLGQNGLDEIGSAATWRKQYERTVSGLIGPYQGLASIRR